MGGVSQIEVELLLFKEAYKSKEHYLYYHLISGTDMPLKTQDEIHSFFFDNYPKEFIGFLLNKSCKDRVNKVYLFPKHQRVKNVVSRKFLSVLRHAFVFIQKCFRYNHYKLNDRLVMGANWVSITEKAVEVILQNEDEIMKQYKYSSCADEVYKQTIIMNSALFDNVYNKDDCYNGCMRLIDWKRGKPYIFRSEDYNQLISSDKMFARKFDEDVDFNIVEKLFWTLSKHKIYNNQL